MQCTIDSYKQIIENFESTDKSDAAGLKAEMATM